MGFLVNHGLCGYLIYCQRLKSSALDGQPQIMPTSCRDVCVQDWVVATDIRIVLNRINTFRDEVFGDPNVLRSYFYAISDLAVGGRSVFSND